MNKEPIATIPIILNPKKFYICSPVISKLHFFDDAIVITTGEKEQKLSRNDISEVSVKEGLAIISLTESDEKIVFYGYSIISTKTKNHDLTHIAAFAIKKFIKGEIISPEINSLVKTTKKRHKRSIVLTTIYFYLLVVILPPLLISESSFKELLFWWSCFILAFGASLLAKKLIDMILLSRDLWNPHKPIREFNKPHAVFQQCYYAIQGFMKDGKYQHAKTLYKKMCEYDSESELVNELYEKYPLLELH